MQPLKSKNQESMKSKNQRKRDIFRALVILELIVLASCLILKLCNYEVSDWLFIADSILLIFFFLLYRNYDQATKEDKKYGNR